MASPTTKARVRTVVLALAAVVAIVLLVVSLHSQYADVKDRIHELSVWAIVVAVVTAVVGGFGSMLAWRTILGDLGSPLPFVAASRVFFLGQLGKYIPGSIWSVVGQMELAKAHHVPRTRSGAASALALVVSVLSGLLVAGVLLPAFARGALAHYWPVFIALPFALAALFPPILNRLVAKALQLARRAPLEQDITGRAIVRALGWSGVAWAAWGAGIWALARDEGDGGARAFVVCVGAFALAWVAGFLVLIVPAGAGIREAVLVAVLSTGLHLPAGAPLLLALVSRLALTAADVVLGLLVLPAARRSIPAEEPVDEAPVAASR